MPLRARQTQTVSGPLSWFLLGLDCLIVPQRGGGIGDDEFTTLKASLYLYMIARRPRCAHDTHVRLSIVNEENILQLPHLHDGAAGQDDCLSGRTWPK